MTLKLWLYWSTVESLFLPHHHIYCLYFSPKQNKNKQKWIPIHVSLATWLQIREGVVLALYWAKGWTIAGKGIIKEGLCSVGHGTISLITTAAYSCTIFITAHLGKIFNTGGDHLLQAPCTGFASISTHSFSVLITGVASSTHPMNPRLILLMCAVRDPAPALSTLIWEFSKLPSLSKL